MGQLRPVNAKSLFTHELVSKVTESVKENPTGVDSLYGAWIWREVQKVVILRKNFRSLDDPEYTNLLARIRLGMAWDGRTPMTSAQKGENANYTQSDFKTLHARQLQGLAVAEQKLFEDAPIICATKVVRDLINRELTRNHANKTRRAVHDYHAHDTFHALPLDDNLQRRTWLVRSTDTKDALGKLPLSIGMKVMVMENVALKASVVNGAEGILREIRYSVDEKGRRYADCAYVEIKGSNFGMHPLGVDIVPIVPGTSYFPYIAEDGTKFSVGRNQLPLLPAYAYTDYKAQGKSLKRVNVDLNGAASLQSFYVMVSRATSLKSLAVLRNFRPSTMQGRLGQDFRDEFARLEILDARTKMSYEQSHQPALDEMDVDPAEDLY
ncbi:hypothetical protein C8R44DRAFT_603193 [Mycena epipterygia]|nr:hypothetical protein C8R44DRAFT_603193 [Mycena epipterygia]